jgi:pyroglutamyl-peptidase
MHENEVLVLITSFDVWKSHQPSNSSDDLLEHWLIEQSPSSRHYYLLRRLPVDFEQAPQQTISQINRLHPALVICCGMAERRTQLSLETQARMGDRTLSTSLPVQDLLRGLPHTCASHDAGSFVCNHLYYSVLDYVAQHQLPTQALFVHVPILTTQNQAEIVADFTNLLSTLQALAQVQPV